MFGLEQAVLDGKYIISLVCLSNLIFKVERKMLRNCITFLPFVCSNLSDNLFISTALGPPILFAGSSVTPFRSLLYTAIFSVEIGRKLLCIHLSVSQLLAGTLIMKSTLEIWKLFMWKWKLKWEKIKILFCNFLILNGLCNWMFFHLWFTLIHQ